MEAMSLEKSHEVTVKRGRREVYIIVTDREKFKKLKEEGRTVPTTTEEINAFIEEKFKFIYDNIHPNCYKEINKIKKEIKSQVLQESKKAYTQGVESGYGKRKAEYRRDF